MGTDNKAEPAECCGQRGGGAIVKVENRGDGGGDAGDAADLLAGDAFEFD